MTIPRTYKDIENRENYLKSEEAKYLMRLMPKGIKTQMINWFLGNSNLNQYQVIKYMTDLKNSIIGHYIKKNHKLFSVT